MHYKELPNITKKQSEIVKLVFQYRFANRVQIQRYLKHKDPKRINAWLKDLVEKQYLGRIYSHKLLENTKPAIYFLHNNGILYNRFNAEEINHSEGLLDFIYVKKYYKDKRASTTFVKHCVSICEICIQFLEFERKTTTVKFELYTKSEHLILLQLRGEEYIHIKKLVPDVALYEYTETKDHKIESVTYFVELFDPRVPRYAIRYKIRQFLSLYKAGNRQTIVTSTESLSCILVFPTQAILNKMSKYLNDLIKEDDFEDPYFILTTHSNAMKYGIKKSKCEIVI